MAKPLSEDLRMRVSRAVDGGMSRRAGAERFGISPSSAVRFVREWRERGATPGGDQLTWHPGLSRRDFKLDRGQAEPDVSRDRRDAQERTVRSDGSWTVTRSPSKTVHAAEQDRPDVAAARQAWRALALDSHRLVFIDEIGASTRMVRLNGRSKRGRRCCAPMPHGHWLTTTFTAALRRTALTAPMTLERLINAVSFRAYIEQVLAPKLNPRRHRGDGQSSGT